MPRFQKVRKAKSSESLAKDYSPRTELQPPSIDESFYGEHGLDGPLTKMFTDLNSLSFSVANSPDGTQDEGLSCGIAEAEKYIDTMLRGGWYDARSTTKGVVAGRAFIVLAGYIYLYLFLRRIEVSSRLYDWMVSLLREDLGNVEHTMRKTCSPELLFWILVIGASGSVGRRESNWFLKELRVSKDVLALGSWEDARAILSRFASVEGWKDEFVGEKIWSEL